jgi:hypothetical protein
VERETEVAVDEIVGRARGIGRRRHHVARQAKLRIARGGQRVELPALLPDQHVRAHHVGAARQVDADERDLAGTLDGDAAALAQQLEVR